MVAKKDKKTLLVILHTYLSKVEFKTIWHTLIFPPQARERGRVSIRISSFCVVVDRVFSHNKKGGSVGTFAWWWRRTTQKLSRGDDLIDCKLSPSQQMDLTAAKSEQCNDGIKSLSMETSWAFKKNNKSSNIFNKIYDKGLHFKQ